MRKKKHLTARWQDTPILILSNFLQINKGGGEHPLGVTGKKGKKRE